MNQIWIIEKGENGQGGFVFGVYANRDLARDAFTAMAMEIDHSFGISSAGVDSENSTITVEGGCDWLTLAPYDVQTQLQIEK